MLLYDDGSGAPSSSRIVMRRTKQIPAKLKLYRSRNCLPSAGEWVVLTHMDGRGGGLRNRTYSNSVQNGAHRSLEMLFGVRVRGQLASEKGSAHYLLIATFDAAYGNPIEATPSATAIRIPRV